MPFVEELKEPWIVGLKAEDAGLSQDDIDNNIDTLFTVADANKSDVLEFEECYTLVKALVEAQIDVVSEPGVTFGFLSRTMFEGLLSIQEQIDDDVTVVNKVMADYCDGDSLTKEQFAAFYTNACKDIGTAYAGRDKDAKYNHMVMDCKKVMVTMRPELIQDLAACREKYAAMTFVSSNPLGEAPFDLKKIESFGPDEVKAVFYSAMDPDGDGIFTIEEFVHMQNTLFDANTTLEATEVTIQPNEDDDEDDIKKKEDFNALLGGTVDAAWGFFETQCGLDGDSSWLVDGWVDQAGTANKKWVWKLQKDGLQGLVRFLVEELWDLDKDKNVSEGEIVAKWEQMLLRDCRHKYRNEELTLDECKTAFGFDEGQVPYYMTAMMGQPVEVVVELLTDYYDKEEHGDTRKVLEEILTIMGFQGAKWETRFKVLDEEAKEKGW